MVPTVLLRNKITILVAAILTGCAAPIPIPRPTPISVDKAFRVCAEQEDPLTTGCKRIGATAPITIRGYTEED